LWISVKIMLINFVRIVKAGWTNFWRNFWLSCATVSTMIIAIFVFTGLLLSNVLTGELIKSIQDKVDVSVYLNKDIQESDVVLIKQELLKMSEVTKVEYITKDDALNQFKERHKNDPFILESLEELGENPLQAILNVKAANPDSYKKIAEFLEQDKYKDLIEKVNYRQNEVIISKVFQISDAIKKTGIVISIILALIAGLVAFNTIRLAIYSSREEVSVMRLVGASNWFIRGPFLLQGIISGTVAALINWIVFFGVTWRISPQINNFLPGADIFHYYQSHLFQMLLLLLATGIALGAFSSYIAIRRYLRE